MSEIEKKEFEALINLLDDPDEKIYKQIKEKILAYGNDIIHDLEGEWEKSQDSTFQARVEELIHQIQFENVLSSLKSWVMLGGRNLLTASILISKYQYPEMDDKKVEQKIEQIKRDVWLELNNNLTALEKIKILNHIVYEVHGFKGNKSDINSPQSCFLNNVLETKKGNPLSLSLLYAIIAQDLDLPVLGVDLPEYFILAYEDKESLLPNHLKGDTNVLFYINSYSNGSIFGQKEIDLFLKQLKINPEKKYYNPCSNLQTIKRLVKSLGKNYSKLGLENKSKDMEQMYQVMVNAEKSLKGS